MKRFLPALALFYCALIWGSTFFIVKDALSSVHPIAMVGHRFIISALIMLPVVLMRKKLTANIKEGAILAGFLFLLYAFQTWGLKYTTAANSGLITGLFVIFVPAFLYFMFRKRITGEQWVAVVLAIVGLWILTGGIRGFNVGDALTLVAAPTYAIHVVLTDKYVRQNTDLYAVIFHQFWIMGALGIILSLVMGWSLEITSQKGLMSVLFLAIFPSCLAYFAQIWAQKTASPVQTSLVFSLEPVFAVIFAWTIGGEHFRLPGLIGGAIIFASILVSETGRFFVKRK